MKEFLNKLKKSILLYTFIYAIIFITLRLIVSIFNMNYREWIYIVSLSIIIIGFIIGIIQLICLIKKKSVKWTLIVMFIILLIPIIFLTFIYSIFNFPIEHTVIRDGKKMIASVSGTMQVTVKYYDYKNFLFVGDKVKVKEYYGKGAFDPIKNKYGIEYTPLKITYYDDNGKLIREEITPGIP